tara:strand:+ start:813 stop:962 length:150 start_codon:yes stop_codon:yes gene_type:complete
MKIIFKFSVYLVLTGSIGLILYAYLGPFFGVSFEPVQIMERIPVVLNES